MSKHCWTLKDRFESQFSAAFYPIMLSDTKRAEIIHRAEEIRAVRNDISEVFFSDMLGFQDMTKFEAFNFFNPAFNTRLSSHYLKKAIEDVWRAYQLRFDAIRKKIEFTNSGGKDAIPLGWRMKAASPYLKLYQIIANYPWFLIYSTKVFSETPPMVDAK